MLTLEACLVRLILKTAVLCFLLSQSHDLLKPSQLHGNSLENLTTTDTCLELDVVSVYLNLLCFNLNNLLSIV